jgi:hypothetical protein
MSLSRDLMELISQSIKVSILISSTLLSSALVFSPSLSSSHYFRVEGNRPSHINLGYLTNSSLFIMPWILPRIYFQSSK